MNLYLLRHGIAVEPSDWNHSEQDRPLTDEGTERMKKAARGMRELSMDLNWILTSPYRRAFQTAEIVAEALEKKDCLKISKSLAVDGQPKALLRHLALDYKSWESVLIVGHEPMMGHLLSILTTGTSQLAMQYKKGMLCKLTADSLTYGACATLQWILPSKILRQLA